MRRLRPGGTSAVSHGRDAADRGGPRPGTTRHRGGSHARHRRPADRRRSAPAAAPLHAPGPAPGRDRAHAGALTAPRAADHAVLPQGPPRQLRQARAGPVPDPDLHRRGHAGRLDRALLGREPPPGAAPARPVPGGGRHHRAPDLRPARLRAGPLVPPPRGRGGARRAPRGRLPRRGGPPRRRHRRGRGRPAVAPHPPGRRARPAAAALRRGLAAAPGRRSTAAARRGRRPVLPDRRLGHRHPRLPQPLRVLPPVDHRGPRAVPGARPGRRGRGDRRHRRAVRRVPGQQPGLAARLSARAVRRPGPPAHHLERGRVPGGHRRCGPGAPHGVQRLFRGLRRAGDAGRGQPARRGETRPGPPGVPPPRRRVPRRRHRGQRQLRLRLRPRPPGRVRPHRGLDRGGAPGLRHVPRPDALSRHAAVRAAGGRGPSPAPRLGPVRHGPRRVSPAPHDPRAARARVRLVLPPPVRRALRLVPAPAPGRRRAPLPRHVGPLQARQRPVAPRHPAPRRARRLAAHAARGAVEPRAGAAITERRPAAPP